MKQTFTITVAVDEDTKALEAISNIKRALDRDFTIIKVEPVVTIGKHRQRSIFPQSKTTPAAMHEANGIIEYHPGKFTSETGHWYFSCDTGKSVLIGVKEFMDKPHYTGWTTCPILGLKKICDYEGFNGETYMSKALRVFEDLLAQNAPDNIYEGSGIGYVTIKQWNDSVGEVFGMREPFNDNENERIYILIGEGGLYVMHGDFE